MPIDKCRACGSDQLLEFLDLGMQYLSDFKKTRTRPPQYPLNALLCDVCKLVQLGTSVPQQQMYHENYGFKSGINELIRADLDDVVTHAFQYINDPQTWLDIASNDGTLLSFVPKDVYRVGVDPVKFLCEEAGEHANLIINDYFNNEVGRIAKHLTAHGFDVITSISCFYDMPDPSRFVEDVKFSLSPTGVWVIQQNYLLTTMQLNAVDNFCHEHLEYYTLLSLENLLDRFDLEVNEVSISRINGGSIRTVVSHKDTFPIHRSVQHQRNVEEDWWLSNISPYKTFASEIADELNTLHRLVVNMKADGKSIGILAASTRGATIWQTAGIDKTLVDYAVERNPAKVGKYFSALGIPIISEAECLVRMPDALLVGPWFFADQIIDRETEYLSRGGQLVIPLPRVEVISGN